MVAFAVPLCPCAMTACAPSEDAWNSTGASRTHGFEESGKACCCDQTEACEVARTPGRSCCPCPMMVGRVLTFVFHERRNDPLAGVLLFTWVDRVGEPARHGLGTAPGVTQSDEHPPDAQQRRATLCVWTI